LSLEFKKTNFVIIYFATDTYTTMARIDRPMKYDANHIIGVHGLSRNITCEILEKLTSATGLISDSDLTLLEIHRDNLVVFGEYWNEEELKMFFLAHIFYI
jgi:hypothetical protein